MEVVEGPVPPCEPVPEAAGTIGAIQLPASAEADEAASAAAAAATPAAGQFLYEQTMVVQLLNWEPVVHLREGLQRTMDAAGVEALIGEGRS